MFFRSIPREKVPPVAEGAPSQKKMEPLKTVGLSRAVPARQEIEPLPPENAARSYISKIPKSELNTLHGGALERILLKRGGLVDLLFLEGEILFFEFYGHEHVQEIFFIRPEHG